MDNESGELLEGDESQGKEDQSLRQRDWYEVLGYLRLMLYNVEANTTGVLSPHSISLAGRKPAESWLKAG